MKKKPKTKEEQAINEALDILSKSGVDMSQMFEEAGLLALSLN